MLRDLSTIIAGDGVNMVAVRTIEHDDLEGAAADWLEPAERLHPAAPAHQVVLVVGAAASVFDRADVRE